MNKELSRTVTYKRRAIAFQLKDIFHPSNYIALQQWLVWNMNFRKSKDFTDVWNDKASLANSFKQLERL